jgi:hypothetical protein
MTWRQGKENGDRAARYGKQQIAFREFQITEK